MKKFFILLFLGGIIVLSSYLVGYYFGAEPRLVWRISNALHFLGGIYGFFFIHSVFEITKKYHNIVTTPLAKTIVFIFGALVLGVLWEWYELFFIYWNSSLLMAKGNGVYLDTMGDLAFDSLGAILAGFYYTTIKNVKNK